jgi:AraC-like DNA-binding protein
MKYLSGTIKRVTGHTVMSFIDRATIPMVKEYLDNDQLSLTQIADRMRFASLSYFSRYCKKHLGMTPSEYRRSKQPNVKS